MLLRGHPGRPDELSIPRIAWSFASDAPESDRFTTILSDLEMRFRQLSLRS